MDNPQQAADHPKRTIGSAEAGSRKAEREKRQQNTLFRAYSSIAQTPSAQPHQRSPLSGGQEQCVDARNVGCCANGQQMGRERERRGAEQGELREPLPLSLSSKGRGEGMQAASMRVDCGCEHATVFASCAVKRQPALAAAVLRAEGN